MNLDIQQIRIFVKEKLENVRVEVHIKFLVLIKLDIAKNVNNLSSQINQNC